MATTKWARYKFVVKESGTEAREVREGFIDLVADPYLVAEPCDDKPLSEYPLEGSDFLSFELAEGTSMKKAQDIAAFLTANVRTLAITKFGDREDARRDVQQSGHERSVDAERLAMVISMMTEKVNTNDIAGIREALRAIESVAVDLFSGWAKANLLAEKVLAEFGDSEESDN